MNPTPTNILHVLRKVASRGLSSVGATGLAGRFDPYNPMVGFLAVNQRTGGLWGLQNVVFAKDPDILELYGRYGAGSRAQILQDLVFLKFFPDAASRKGYFVEVGTGNGENLSNTFLLEKTFGYDGILVEPNPAFHDSIRQRRAARLETRAAYSETGREFDFTVAGELSTILDPGSASHDHHRRSGARIKIQTATLSKILDDAKAPDMIDFLSVDTEGSEIEVMKGLFQGERCARFVSIEHNFDQQRRSDIRKLMAKHGYDCVSTPASLWDDWFVNHKT